MKMFMTALTLFASVSVFAQTSITGESSTVGKCVGKAINLAIKNQLKETNKLTSNISASYEIKTTYTEHEVYRTVTSELEKFNQALKDLDYTKSEEDLCQDRTEETDKYMNGSGYTIQEVQSSPIFKIKTYVNGVLKYSALAQLKKVQRVYSNDGQLQRTSCELRDVTIKSAHTQAVLLKVK